MLTAEKWNPHFSANTCNTYNVQNVPIDSHANVQYATKVSGSIYQQYTVIPADLMLFMPAVQTLCFSSEQHDWLEHHALFWQAALCPWWRWSINLHAARTVFTEAFICLILYFSVINTIWRISLHHSPHYCALQFYFTMSENQILYFSILLLFFCFHSRFLSKILKVKSVIFEII